MNTLMMSALAAMFAMSGTGISTVPPRDTQSNNLGNEDSPQQVDQSKAAKDKVGKAVASSTTQQQLSRANVKKMDSNADGLVSKAEYMAYHGRAYGKLRQTNGEVSVRDMQYGRTGTANTSSMNNKPIGKTTGRSTNGSTDDTRKDDPINGTTTGTN
jgi:hypothetical protein